MDLHRKKCKYHQYCIKKSKRTFNCKNIPLTEFLFCEYHKNKCLWSYNCKNNRKLHQKFCIKHEKKIKYNIDIKKLEPIQEINEICGINNRESDNEYHVQKDDDYYKQKIDSSDEEYYEKDIDYLDNNYCIQINEEYY